MTTTSTEVIENDISKLIDKGGGNALSMRFINDLLDLRVNQEQLNTHTAAITSLRAVPVPNKKAIESHEKEQRLIRNQIKILEDNRAAFSARLATVYDSMFPTDIQTLVQEVPVGRSSLTENRSSRAQGIREEAERRFKNRDSGHDAFVRELRKTPPAIRAKNLISQPIKERAKSAADASQERIDTGSESGFTQKTLDALDKYKIVSRREEDKQDTVQQNQTTAESRVKGTPAPPVAPGQNFQDTNVSQKEVPKAGVKGTLLPTTTKVSQVKVLGAPVVDNVTEASSFTGGDPLQTQLKETQLFVEDILDPRHIDFFIPQSYVNQVPAYMSIIKYTQSKNKIDTKNNLRPVIDDPFNAGNQPRIYNQFSLTQTIEIYSEKFQVDDTMSEGNLVYFFGEKPEIWTFSGTLLNDLLHAWHPKMRAAWHDHIRGSVLVKNDSFLAVVIPSAWLVIECYPIGLSISHTVDMESISPFTMSVFVKSAKTLPGLEVRNTPAKVSGSTAVDTSLQIAQVLESLKKPNAVSNLKADALAKKLTAI